MTTHHSQIYQTAMVTSLCIAALSFVSVVVLMTVTENARQNRTISESMLWSRVRLILALAAASGLSTSLPFALAAGVNNIGSFLMREILSASLIAVGTVIFGLWIAWVVTGRLGVRDSEVDYAGEYERPRLHRINPASGLPMNGALDLEGNPFGWNSRDLPEYRHWDP